MEEGRVYYAYHGLAFEDEADGDAVEGDQVDVVDGAWPMRLANNRI